MPQLDMDTSRSKTAFQIAHPPPVRRSKARLRRPRILLQLHQLSEGCRPQPVLDVLPSAIFAPRLTKRFPQIFKGKDSLGPNDIIVASSDSASSTIRDGDDPGHSSDDEPCDWREVIGTICKPRKSREFPTGTAEICLDQGLAWQAKAMQRGGYEFSANGADGSHLKARWIPRKEVLRRRATSLTLPIQAEAEATERFTFSIVNPTARRHPVIASMTADNIEVHDQYPASVAQTASSTSPSSPASVHSTELSYFDSSEPTTQPLIHTDHHLRSLIIITGIYVLFQEGWANNFTQHVHRLTDQETLSTASATRSNVEKKRTNVQAVAKQPSPPAGVDHIGGSKAEMSPASSVGAAYIARANQRSLSHAKSRGKKGTSALSSGGEETETPQSSRPASWCHAPTLKISEISRSPPDPGRPLRAAVMDGASVTDGGEDLGTGGSRSLDLNHTLEEKRRPGKRSMTFQSFFGLICSRQVSRHAKS